MSSIESVYLVEASPALRDTQKQLLCGDAPVEEIDIGFRSTSKYSSVPVTWCEDIRFVPNGRFCLISQQTRSISINLSTDSRKTPFIFAHEFFDALPIHAFQSIAPKPNEMSQALTTPTGSLPLTNPKSQSKTLQWRELVVTPTPPASSTTTTTSSFTPKTRPDFQLSLAKASTSSSLLFPTLSQRYKALLPIPGSVIEISPESQSYTADFARRIGGSSSRPSPKSSTTFKSRPSGAALIFDYGPADTIPASTLRGIRSHEPMSPFTLPGLVDISADVDFTALAEAALAASPGVEVHGPVEQGAWLQSMGIRERAEMICKGLGEDEAGKRRVRGAIQRLVERGGGAMGKIYKALAIVPEGGGRRPIGFGGSLE